MRIGPLVAVLLFGLGLLVAVVLVRRHVESAPDLTRFDEIIEASAREFDVDANLLRGLVAVESGGDPAAVSRAGAIGLMQLMPATAKEQAERLRIGNYSETRLREPALNVRLGSYYLARLLKRFEGEVPFALAAYNAGPTRVRRWRARAPEAEALEVIESEGFDETRAHLKRALRFREAYRLRYGKWEKPAGP